MSGMLLGRKLGIGLLACAAFSASVAFGSPLPPGGTLDPLPGASAPSGAMLLDTFARDFDISFPGPFPFTYHCRATVTQNVYRLPDNTIAFRYVISNASNSQGAVTLLSARDFSDWTTDVYFQSGIGTLYWPDRARRGLDGSAVSFEYDLGVPTDSTSRAMWVRTDATSYLGSRGPLFYTQGRVTLATGTHLQTLYGFAFPVTDSTPPVISITGPSQLSCACNPVTITGTAYDNGGFAQYTLEYAANANGPWTEITTSTTPVNPAGTLATWNTTGVTEGYYFVRLTAVNLANLSSAVTSVVYVDKAMSPVLMRSPGAGPGGTTQILGGTVCFDGTVWDTCGSTYSIMYRALPSGSFAPVVSGTPSYPGQIITDGLGSWSTASGPTAVADGLYQVRVMGVDSCGNVSSALRDVRIDNTRPVAQISSPEACVNVNGTVQVTGQVSDANLAGWTLQYTGGASHGWVTIASGSSNVNGVLASWDTSRLRPCAYVLRLLAGDASAVNCGSTTNQTEYLTTVLVGCAADFNRSGDVNSQDFFDFLTAFFSPCP